MMEEDEILRNMNRAVREAREENFARLGYNAYRDSRCTEDNHFVVEKLDGTEVISAYNVLTGTFSEIERHIPTPVNAG